MTDASNNAFRLGEWLVEPDLNRISSPRSSTHLEPISMAVLVLLHGRAGEVVSTEEIINSVWRGRPMGDNPVYKSIAKLRKALGDDDLKHPRFITTVSKKGYRLVVDGDARQPPAQPAGRELRGKRPSLRMLAMFAIVAGAAFLLAMAAFWQRQAPTASVKPLSTFPGSHTHPSLAPDGQSHAFVSDTGGTPHVWILEPGKQAPRQLTSGDRADARPRWSPDGRSILFARANSLLTVAVAGGRPREIVRDAYNPNWSRDGKRIVFERRSQVWTAMADGSRQEQVAGVPRRELALSARWPAFSPDGTQIVYFDSDSTPMGDLWVIPRSGGTPQRMTFAPALGSAPVWSADGRRIIYSSQRGGSRTLWAVDVDDRTASALLVGSGDDDFPDISADGKHVIYVNSRERYTLLASDPARGTERVLHESRLPLFGPELSPNGDSIAMFGFARDGGVQLFTMPTRGGPLTAITSDPLATHAMPRWSADGKSLFFYRTAAGTDFSSVRSAGGAIEPIVAGWDWTRAHAASVSPDGTSVAYSRLTGLAPVQTLIRDLGSGGERTFHATLEYPRWSADGRWLIGSRFVDQRFPGDVAICPLSGHHCRILAAGARLPRWSVDGSEVYFVRGFGRSQDLFSIPADGSGGEQKRMRMAALDPLGPFYDVTADGGIVWIRHAKEQADIWMLELR